MSGISRRTWLIIAAVVVAVGLAVALVLGNARGDDTASDAPSTPVATTAAPTPTPDASSAPAPVASSAAPTSKPAASPTSKATPKPSSRPSQTAGAEAPGAGPAVPLDSEAEPLPGITVSVSDVERVAGAGDGPGQIDGPAARFTVQVDNGGDDEVDLSKAVVNAYFGPDLVPGVQLSGPGARTMPGKVAAGSSVSGTYVFLLPASGATTLTVELFVTPDSDPVTWSGALPAA
jgi:hypothetical protein